MAGPLLSLAEFHARCGACDSSYTSASVSVDMFLVARIAIRVSTVLILIPVLMAMILDLVEGRR